MDSRWLVVPGLFRWFRISINLRFNLDQREKSKDSFTRLGILLCMIREGHLLLLISTTREFRCLILMGISSEIAVEAKTSSVAFTESGDLLSYVVRDHNKLALYSECGQFIWYISDEHVKTPWYISVESDGRIITCNIADKRIKILSADGKNLLKSFRAPGCDVEP